MFDYLLVCYEWETKKMADGVGTMTEFLSIIIFFFNFTLL